MINNFHSQTQILLIVHPNSENNVMMWQRKCKSSFSVIVFLNDPNRAFYTFANYHYTVITITVNSFHSTFVIYV